MSHGDSTTSEPREPGEPGEPGEHDPLRARRAQVARWTLLANRLGYLFLAVAVATFLVAFAVGFSSGPATVVVATFVVACVLLAPSIVIGYAVKAAARDDRARGL
jgi:heme/copper-type cytochrome/quinol oxidase subunit 3